MTEEQARSKSESKITKIKELAKLLQVRMSAKQVVSQGGIIETVIFYTDEEKYDIDKPAPVPPGPIKKSNVKDTPSQQ